MHALVDDLVPVGLDLALADILKLLCSGTRMSLCTTASQCNRGRTMPCLYSAFVIQVPTSSLRCAWKGEGDAVDLHSCP